MQLMSAEQKEVETASDALARLMGSCALRGATRDGVLATLATISAVLHAMQIIASPELPDQHISALAFAEGFLDQTAIQILALPMAAQTEH